MRILLIGYGTMNKIVARLAVEKGHEIAGVISSGTTDYPVYTNIDDAGADVAIDFSNPDRILPLVEKPFTTPLVVATTGKKEEIVAALKERAASAPVFFNANMSYGVHVLNNLLREALKQLDGFDLELVERHHKHKVDAPSGTLVKLLDTALDVRQSSYPVYDRSEANEERSDDEIGVSAIRGGTIVGEHDAIFAGHDEVIELKHIAQSKDIFANGAIGAAESLIHKENGFYDYNNIF